MLGKRILDPKGIESDQSEIAGLGLFPIETIFNQEKVTKQVKARHLQSGKMLEGYEIHMGLTTQLEEIDPILEITEYGGDKVSLSDGCSIRNGQVWGTYLHGLFDNDEFRRDFLNDLRIRKGYATSSTTSSTKLVREEVFDRLANLIRKNIDRDLFLRLLEKKKAL